MTYKMKKSQELGLYLPSTFFIDVPSDYPIKDMFDEMSHSQEYFDSYEYDSTPATVFHEYVHFLQDLLTPACMWATIDFIEAIITLWHKYHLKDQINIPLSTNRISYDGSNINIDFDLDSVKSLKLSVLKNIIHAKIEFIDNYDCTYLLGRNCIEESMAYELEQGLFKKHDQSPALPYQMVRLVMTHCIKGFTDLEKLDQRRCIVALCEASMSAPNSGFFMHEIVQAINAEKLVLRADNIISFSKKLRFKTDHGLLGLDSAYSLFKSIARKSLFKLFTHENFQILNQTVERFYDNAEKFRSRYNFNFHHLFDNPYLYIDATNMIGMPLIFNETKDEDGKDDYPYFDYSFTNVCFHILACLRAIYEIYGTTHGQQGCELYNYCTKAKVNVDDVICNDTPWKMVKKHACPYAQLWKLFGFPSQVNVIFNKTT